jgi:hypothetical protein
MRSAPTRIPARERTGTTASGAAPARTTRSPSAARRGPTGPIASSTFAAIRELTRPMPPDAATRLARSSACTGDSASRTSRKATTINPLCVARKSAPAAPALRPAGTAARSAGVPGSASPSPRSRASALAFAAHRSFASRRDRSTRSSSRAICPARPLNQSVDHTRWIVQPHASGTCCRSRSRSRAVSALWYAAPGGGAEGPGRSHRTVSGAVPPRQRARPDGRHGRWARREQTPDARQAGAGEGHGGPPSNGGNQGGHDGARRSSRAARPVDSDGPEEEEI